MVVNPWASSAKDWAIDQLSEWLFVVAVHSWKWSQNRNHQTAPLHQTWAKDNMFHEDAATGECAAGFATSKSSMGQGLTSFSVCFFTCMYPFTTIHHDLAALDFLPRWISLGRQPSQLFSQNRYAAVKCCEAMSLYWGYGTTWDCSLLVLQADVQNPLPL